MEPAEITPAIEKRFFATMAQFSLDNNVHPVDLFGLMVKSALSLYDAIETTDQSDLPKTQVESLLNEAALRAYIKEGL